MRCTDTNGELPVIYLSEKAVQVACEFDRYEQAAASLGIHEWMVTFRNQGSRIASAKFEFLNFFKGKKAAE